MEILELVNKGYTDFIVKNDSVIAKGYGKKSITYNENCTYITLLKKEIEEDLRNSERPKVFEKMGTLDGMDTRIIATKELNGYVIFLRVLRTVDSMDNTESISSVVERLKDAKIGLHLITGPIGSGKTSLMYRIMEEYCKGDSTIVTVEDPIEHQLNKTNGVVRFQVGTHVRSYEEGIKCAVKMDADNIFIGEIRDRETAELALKVAMSGHRVFTTMISSGVGPISDTISTLFKNEYTRNNKLSEYISTITECSEIGKAKIIDIK